MALAKTVKRRVGLVALATGPTGEGLEGRTEGRNGDRCGHLLREVPLRRAAGSGEEAQRLCFSGSVRTALYADACDMWLPWQPGCWRRCLSWREVCLCTGGDGAHSSRGQADGLWVPSLLLEEAALQSPSSCSWSL